MHIGYACFFYSIFRVFDFELAHTLHASELSIVLTLYTLQETAEIVYYA